MLEKEEKEAEFSAHLFFSLLTWLSTYWHPCGQRNNSVHGESWGNKGKEFKSQLCATSTVWVRWFSCGCILLLIWETQIEFQWPVEGPDSQLQPGPALAFTEHLGTDPEGWSSICISQALSASQFYMYMFTCVIEYAAYNSHICLKTKIKNMILIVDDLSSILGILKIKSMT